MAQQEIGPATRPVVEHYADEGKTIFISRHWADQSDNCNICSSGDYSKMITSGLVDESGKPLPGDYAPSPEEVAELQAATVGDSGDATNLPENAIQNSSPAGDGGGSSGSSSEPETGTSEVGTSQF